MVPNRNMSVTMSTNNAKITNETCNDTKISNACSENMAIPIFLEVESNLRLSLVLLVVECGLLGNLITVFKICMNKVFHNITYFAIMMMAIADTVCLVQHNVHILLAINKLESNKVVTEFFMVAYFVSTHSSAGHVINFMCVRYYVTVYPLRVRAFNEKKLIYSSILIWILSFLFGAVYYIFRFHVCYDIVFLVMTIRGYLLIVPVAIIIILHCMKRRALAKSISVNIINPKAKRRICLMTTLIIIIYISSAVVYPVCFLLRVTFKHCSHSCHLAARFMWLINVTINPVLYFLFSPPIYNSIRRRMSSLRETSI